MGEREREREGTFVEGRERDKEGVCVGVWVCVCSSHANFS